MKSTRFWIILIGIVFAASSIAAAMIYAATASGGIACVYQDGVLIERVDLSKVIEPYTFTVEYDNGANVIAAEHGRICIAESDCPDGSCVRQGYISGGAVPIVCLPHRLVIKIEGAKAPDVDAVAG